MQRVAARRGHARLIQPERGERRPAGDRDLRADEIDPQHLLGDGMLHLEARIGLDKGEAGVVVACAALDEELERAEAVIADRAGDPRGGLDDARTRLRAQRRAGRDLDQLLVAALDRTFALPQMAEAAVPVADDLHLDMASVADQSLDIDAVVAERRSRLRSAAGIGLGELRGVLHDAHPPPATAGDGLDHHRRRRAERCEEGVRFLKAGLAPGRFDHRHAALAGECLGLRLVPEQFQHLGRRPDERHALRRAAPRQCGILAQEAVAGMERVAPRALRRVDDRVDIEIGLRPAPRKLDRFVGGTDMQRQRVIRRIDRDAGDPFGGGGPRDADRYLSPVRDQQFLERHRVSPAGNVAVQG